VTAKRVPGLFITPFTMPDCLRRADGGVADDERTSLGGIPSARRWAQALSAMRSAGALEDLVEDAALALVQQHDRDEIERDILAEGVDSTTAERLVLLIPSAFAREHFEPEGILFPDHFLVGPPGAHVERAYAQEPVYQAARILARRWRAESRDSLILRVLDWSAEAASIKEARDKGLTPERMSAVHHGFGA
jgi:hypothetical protein